MAVTSGVSPKHLDQSGWGVIFPYKVTENILRALEPLLEHRKEEATRNDEQLFRQLTYLPGESKFKFLARHSVGLGPVTPSKLPYYLLIVGDPEEIPFQFQYQLDVQYAVGRICFETTEEYSNYAAGVVKAEQGRVDCGRRVAVFGVANHDDQATQRCLCNFVTPLSERLSKSCNNRSRILADQEAWCLESALGQHATKPRLSEFLGGNSTPAFLLTVGHGLGFDMDDPRHLLHQGALLCCEWPGPQQWKKAIPTEHYFSYEDVKEQASLAGLIAFHCSSFGAGTPRLDSYTLRESSRQLAPWSFVAKLPQRLLSHPSGSALAVVGHCDRTWSYSLGGRISERRVSLFQGFWDRLLDGYPVGAAMEYFDQDYAELSSDLSLEIREIEYGVKPDYVRIASLWAANNDARSCIVLGDPAVRLIAESDGAAR